MKDIRLIEPDDHLSDLSPQIDFIVYIGDLYVICMLIYVGHVLRLYLDLQMQREQEDLE